MTVVAGAVATGLGLLTPEGEKPQLMAIYAAMAFTPLLLMPMVFARVFLDRVAPKGR